MLCSLLRASVKSFGLSQQPGTDCLELGRVSSACLCSNLLLSNYPQDLSRPSILVLTAWSLAGLPLHVCATGHHSYLGGALQDIAAWSSALCVVNTRTGDSPARKLQQSTTLPCTLRGVICEA